MIPKPSAKSRPRASDPIGIFDSGVGGLSVLRELRRILPRERFVFLADQSHVPYGAKTGAQLESLTSRITRFLLSRRCKLVVVACNTATCYAIDHLRSRFATPFIGTVPAIKPAAATTRTGVIGSISTPATARSPALRKLIREYAKGVKTVVVGCPGLEELVESGVVDDPRATELLKKYLKPIISAGADTVVLGCTHYPFLKPMINRLTSLRTVDSGRAVARRTRVVLDRLGLRSPRRRGADAFYTTGDAREFSSVASALLDRPVRSQKTRI